MRLTVSPATASPTQVFTTRGFEALFPCAGTLGCTVCLTPQLFLPVYPHANVGPVGLPGLLATALPAQYASRRLAMHPVCASCPSLPLLQVWMNVSSLAPWLSDFHAVHFSDSSGGFLFLNLFLSFFWLCKEAKYIYLCFHLG